MDIGKYVIPVFGEAQCGCGFFVGNIFITAGHVALKCNLPLTIWFNGNKLRLGYDNLIKIAFSKELSSSGECGDFAVFRFEDVNSPLVLSNALPAVGQKLCCITYDTIHSDTNIGGIPAIFSQEERISNVVTSAIVRAETKGNFFACDTESILHEGNSGSPLIDADNKVVGILHAGTKIPDCCVFQSAFSIASLMK